MTLTIDELVKVFHDAYGAQPYSGVGHFDLGSRAGIRAIVRALRDEMLDDLAISTEPSIDDEDVFAWFNQILGDAGDEVAGACADGTVVQRQRYGENDRQSKDGAEVPPRHPDPATAPAPAVCEWKQRANKKWRRGCCGGEGWRYAFKDCPCCGKPIKFTEANHG